MAMTREQALDAAWRVGSLRGLAFEGRPLHSGQIELLDEFNRSESKIFVIECARQWGKSIFAVTVSAEAALKGRRVLMASDEQKHIRSIVQPNMRSLLQTCPKDMAPNWDGQEQTYTFKSGGIIRLIGLDKGQADKGRGTKEDLVVIDEAGFAQELQYFVESIAIPQITHTDGRILAISTPSVSEGHYFRVLGNQAAEMGAKFTRTFWDIPDKVLSKEKKEKIERDEARRLGANSTEWRRERLCEWVTEETRAVIPEWHRHRADIVKEPEPCSYPTEKYTSVDVGYHDLTFSLFAYFDFPRDVLVVEDELVHRMTTPDLIGKDILDREVSLWGYKRPLVRVVDADPIVRAQMTRSTGITVMPVQKHKAANKHFKDASIAFLRRAIQDHELVIHPRCRILQAHVAQATWNANRTDFERPDHSQWDANTPLGHFDGLAALIYLNWTIRKNRDPRSKLAPGVDQHDHHIKESGRPDMMGVQKLRRAFRGKRVRA